MMLFRYFELRTLTRRQAGCSRRKSRNARWLGTWPSSVTLRGARSGCEASALQKNACAAAMPRSGRSMKSMLRPCLSTARYRWWHLPLIERGVRGQVVELSPGLSSPNRTCTSQRIRLSIQVLLKAKATSAECTSPACLAFHRLSKVFTLLQSVTVIRHASHSNCPPSPCGRLSRPPTTTRAPSTCTASGDTLPCHLCKPSPVHMLDSTHGRGCLSQPLSLLSASRRGCHGLATRSP